MSTRTLATTRISPRRIRRSLYMVSRQWSVDVPRGIQRLTSLSYRRSASFYTTANRSSQRLQPILGLRVSPHSSSAPNRSRPIEVSLFGGYENNRKVAVVLVVFRVTSTVQGA
jgi:hypothetical protein